jgi:hypothetical protein
MAKYLDKRVLLVLSAVALGLGIIALVLAFAGLSCAPRATSSDQTCSAGTSGIVASVFYLLYVILAAAVGVLALVKSALAQQWVWFPAIFLFSIFLLGPLVILPYSLIAPDKMGEAARDLRQPDNRDLRFRPPRSA